MGTIIFFCIQFILPFYLLAQPFNIKQITNFDYDSRGAVIPSYPLGVSIFPYSPLFYEAHTGNSVNIMMLTYDAMSDSFFNPTELTKNNFQNINADANSYDYYPNMKINLVWQTNENGNWDIALRTFNGYSWSPKKFLVNSSADEVNPKFLAKHQQPFLNLYDIEILYERDNSIYLYQQTETIINNEVIFSGDSSNKFIQPTGVYYQRGIGFNLFLYIAAVSKPNDTTSIIVYRYKNINDSIWSPIYKAYDSGYCVNSNFYDVFSQDCPLSFEKVTDDKKQVYIIPSIENFGQNFNAVPLILDSNFSTSDFKMFEYGIVSKNQNNLSYNVWGPNGLKLISNDTTYIGHIFYLSVLFPLAYTKVPSTRLGLGNLGYHVNGAVSYCIWEDSSNGRINLFGFLEYYPLGKVGDKIHANNFELYQNYPNPFNPKTIIRYELLSRDFVALKVFDVLGNEIATIVNEEKDAGKYEFLFDASDFDGLASGIYVYRLMVGDNSLSKKMVLLK